MMSNISMNNSRKPKMSERSSTQVLEPCHQLTYQTSKSIRPTSEHSKCDKHLDKEFESISTIGNFLLKIAMLVKHNILPVLTYRII